MMRRLILARALINDPELLILDEPTTGLDPQSRHQAWERIEQLRTDGLSVLLTTHNMDEAFRGAHIVYPKSWAPYQVMQRRTPLLHKGDKEGLKQLEQECLANNARHKHWECDEKKMKLAHKEAIYMHCLPADRGYEVTDAVIDGKQSRVFPEAENRLHTCKSIMALTM